MSSHSQLLMPLFDPVRRSKKVPGDAKQRGNKRGDFFSRIRGGVKRMRGANAFIRSVTITLVWNGECTVLGLSTGLQGDSPGNGRAFF